MHPKNISISSYTYALPDDRVAKYPLQERDASKLLIYKNGVINETVYKEVAGVLPTDSLLVFNNTKVVEARLLFQKPTGGIIEIFCLEPSDKYADITSAMKEKGSILWKCLIGGASKWKHGMKLEKKVNYDDGELLIHAFIAERLPDSFIIELDWQPNDLSFAEVLHLAGAIPLPPYLHRNSEESDKERYQTVYAKHDGSVAAPTAGLHFTKDVFEKLNEKGIKKDFVTLHVGAGTFMPVKANKMAEHEMHAEFLDVELKTIENLIEHYDKTIIAVGTTSLRTLESLYWMGVKVSRESRAGSQELEIHQWEPYETETHLTTKEALTSLVEWMKQNNMERLITKTQIIIAPGYKLKVAKGLITNFHQPNSTLLLLVAAVIGEDWRNVYKYALDNDFRFLSYGDGCLLWGN